MTIIIERHKVVITRSPGTRAHRVFLRHPRLNQLFPRKPPKAVGPSITPDPEPPAPAAWAMLTLCMLVIMVSGAWLLVR